ncbi:MAG: hypoxanthine phosphoribosyltransferase [Bacteroidetes bacterium]|nr:hypoxanthine phosphoribosyltransferase [Bacteroidota bacterium]
MEQAENRKLNLYIDHSQIIERVREIASKINQDYAGKTPIFIGILNGAFVFLSDLIREIKIDCEIDFLKLSSYGDSKISSGDITLLKELNCEIKGKDIIIVEDIIDSGLSIKYMKALIEKNNPSSLRIVTLLYKEETAKLDFEIDYIGFKVDNKFVVGYGLDYAQKYRNLKSIYML